MADPMASLSVKDAPALALFLIQIVGRFVVGAVVGLFAGRSVIASGIEMLVRHIFDQGTDAQVRFLLPSTEHGYKQMALKSGLTSPTVTLSDGTKAFWIGKKDASCIILYFHGGGFCVAASSAHFNWLKATRNELATNGTNAAILMLAYTLAPEATYPTQLKQAVSLLAYLIDVEKIDPSKIILGGDSAGANLALSVLSHILHPHPLIPALTLKEPLLGMYLVSPWITFDFTESNFINNDVDMLTLKTLVRAKNNVLANEHDRDNYNEAVRADASWWASSNKIVKSACIWYGGDEGLRPSIERFLVNFKPHMDLTVLRIPKELHVAVVMEHLLPFGHSVSAEPLLLWLKKTVQA